LKVKGRTDLISDVSLNSKLEVSGNTKLRSRLDIIGDASFNNNVEIKETLKVKGRTDLISDVSLNSKLEVSGNTKLRSRLDIIGDASFNDGLEVSGNTILNSNLEVDKKTTLKDELDVSNNALFKSNVHIKGSLTVDGSFNQLNIQKETIELKDNIIMLNTTDISDSNIQKVIDSGLLIDNIDFSGNKAGIIYDVSTNEFVLRYTKQNPGIDNSLNDISYNYIPLKAGSLDICGNSIFRGQLDLCGNRIRNIQLNPEDYKDALSFGYFDVSFNDLKDKFASLVENILFILDVSKNSIRLAIADDVDPDEDYTFDVSGTGRMRGTFYVDEPIKGNDATTKNYVNNIVDFNQLTNSDFTEINTSKLDVYGKTRLHNDIYIDGSYGLAIGKQDISYNLDISGTMGVLLPKGNDLQRPEFPVDGIIRYNTKNTTFEGYSSGAWGSLGGVKDIDQDTYISAENAPTEDNDQLKFYTDGSMRMIINASGDISMNHNLFINKDASFNNNVDISNNLVVKKNATIYNKLDVSGVEISNNLKVLGNVGFGKEPSTNYKLDVSGNLHISGNLVVDGSMNELHIQKETIEFKDNIISLNTTDISDNTGINKYINTGIQFNNIDSSDANKKSAFIYDVSDKVFKLGYTTIDASSNNSVFEINDSSLSSLKLKVPDSLDNNYYAINKGYLDSELTRILGFNISSSELEVVGDKYSKYGGDICGNVIIKKVDGSGNQNDTDYVAPKNGDLIIKDGSVGIGTTEPGSALHVLGTKNNYDATTGIHMGSYNIGNNNNYAIDIISNSTNTDSYINFGSQGNRNGRINYDNSNNSLSFKTNNSERLVINSSGLVGIGITNPGVSLDVNGTIRTLTGVTINNASGSLFFAGGNGFRINLDGSTKKYGIGVQSNTQYFRTNKNFAFYKGGVHNDNELDASGGTAMMVIKDDNVGIGTTIPTEKLDVSGNIKTNGYIKLENGETISNSTDGTVLINGIVSVGTGTTNGTIQSNGDNDLVLQTGNNITGNITITDGSNGDITLTPNGTGKVVVATGLDVGGATIVNTDNTLTITEATTKFFGDITTTGNATIDGSANISGNLTVTGNLTVNGTTTTVDTTTITVKDPIITIGSNDTDDNKDRGIEFKYKYNNETAKVGFMGYDDSDGKFTMLTDASNNSEVFSGTTGTLKANIEGDLSGTILTATQNSITTMSRLETVGDLKLGSITNGFGNINNGSNSITTTGTISGGTVKATTLQIGDNTITATAAELNILDGDTAATSTIVVDDDRVVLNDDGTMVQVAVTDLDTYFSATTKELTNKTLTEPKFENDGFIADSNGNELLKFEQNNNATNYIILSNSTQNNGPTIKSDGEDTNVSLNLLTKGTGLVNIDANTYVKGNVGIGTNNPQSALSVVGSTIYTPTTEGIHMGKDIDNKQVIEFSTETTGSGYIDFSKPGEGHKGRIHYDGENHIMSINTNGLSTLSVESNGKLNIKDNILIDLYKNTSQLEAGYWYIIAESTGNSTGLFKINSSNHSNITFRASYCFDTSHKLSNFDVQILQNDSHYEITNITKLAFISNKGTMPGPNTEIQGGFNGKHYIAIYTESIIPVNTFKMNVYEQTESHNYNILGSFDRKVNLDTNTWYENISGAFIDVRVIDLKKTVYSIQGNSDNDTNTIKGTHMFNILHNGNIGIGTDDPQENLDVSGNIKTNGYIKLENGETISNATNGTVLINGIVSVGTGSTNGTIQSNGNYDLILKTGNTTTGNITITDGSNGDITLTPNGTGKVVVKTGLDIDGAIRIPVGSTDERPSTEEQGQIRYNTTDSTFEGFDGTNWGSLGGVKSINQENYIEAIDDSGIIIYTNSTERVIIDNSGVINAFNKIHIKDRTTNNYDYLNIYQEGNKAGISLSKDSANNDYITMNNTGAISIGSNNTETGARVFIDSSESNTLLYGALTIVENNDSSNNVMNIYNDASNGYGAIENNNAMVSFKDGNVGIGITNPQTKLDIDGDILIRGKIESTNKNTTHHKLYSNKIFTNTLYTAGNVSIGSGISNSQYKLVVDGSANINGNFYTTNGVITSSDIRIKENIIEINSNKALNNIRNINPRYYNKITNNNREVGLIAQEVKEHIPEAVSVIKGIIPSIYSYCSINENIINTKDKEHNLIINDNVVIELNNQKEIYKVIEIINDKEFIIEGDNKLINLSEVFVYGKEVNDFHVVNYSNIFTILISATQEIDRLQQKNIEDVSLLKEENTNLKTENELLKSRMDSLEARLLALENK
jgi:hypothetical protein